MSVSVLDEDLTTNSGAREVLAFVKPLELGETVTREVNVTFDHPGYYRIVVRADATPLVGELPTLGLRDTVVRSSNWVILWVVVDHSGGRLTNGFASSIAGPQRLPKYGAYGRFVTAPWVSFSGASFESAEIGYFDPPFTQGEGHVYYRNHDDPYLPSQPVPFPEVAGFCITNLFRPYRLSQWRSWRCERPLCHLVRERSLLVRGLD